MMVDANLMNKIKANYKSTHPDKQIYSIIFPQTWPTNGLGNTVCGCDVITTADTVILFQENDGPVAVYFNSANMAYEVQNPNTKFWDDVNRRNLKGAWEADRYEK